MQVYFRNNRSIPKFAWLYSIKCNDGVEVILKLDFQKYTFENPALIISERGSAFQSNLFTNYCKNQNIRHVAIIKGLLWSNSQIERLNTVMISVL